MCRPSGCSFFCSSEDASAMIDRYIAFVERLSRWGGAIAVACLIFAMIVVCQMILTLYVFRGTTGWQNEAVVFSATAAMFIGAPYVLLRKGHVGVDVVMHYASARDQRRLDFIGSVLGLLFCGDGSGHWGALVRGLRPRVDHAQCGRRPLMVAADADVHRLCAVEHAVPGQSI